MEGALTEELSTRSGPGVYSIAVAARCPVQARRHCGSPNWSPTEAPAQVALVTWGNLFVGSKRDSTA